MQLASHKLPIPTQIIQRERPVRVA
jgi:ribosomal protein L16/L10AE